jgi:hypothetical protein
MAVHQPETLRRGERPTGPSVYPRGCDSRYQSDFISVYQLFKADFRSVSTELRAITLDPPPGRQRSRSPDSLVLCDTHHGLGSRDERDRKATEDRAGSRPRARSSVCPGKLAMGEERNPGTAALTVGLCFLAALCEGFDVQAAGVAAGGLSRQLHPTPIDLSAFFAASGAGLSRCHCRRAPGGRFGRKVVLVVSLITFGCLSPDVFCTRDTFTTAARFLTGLSWAQRCPI